MRFVSAGPDADMDQALASLSCFGSGEEERCKALGRQSFRYTVLASPVEFLPVAQLLKEGLPGNCAWLICGHRWCLARCDDPIPFACLGDITIFLAAIVDLGEGAELLYFPFAQTLSFHMGSNDEILNVGWTDLLSPSSSTHPLLHS